MATILPYAKSLRTAGLFAGIAGIERGMERAGHEAILLCEIDPAAQLILKKRIPNAKFVSDIRKIKRLPSCDLVTAGFPCQDLSQCGNTNGIDGQSSSLIREVFRLIEASRVKPEWLLLENVPFMLRLNQGQAIREITSSLVSLGYQWAYRVVDVRAFGLPQRRRRVILMASRHDDPKDVLFADEVPEPKPPKIAAGYGFYWTEGNTGLGWAPDCVPTLKGGSSFGIPSPPAIWIPMQRSIATVDIRDAERLQGFPVNWTKIIEQNGFRAGARWRLVGNAVCVRMAEWIGKRLANPGKNLATKQAEINMTAWPNAAYGDDRVEYAVECSTWPVSRKSSEILRFLRHPLHPLSQRATAGFLARAKKSSLRFTNGFLDDVAHHLAKMNHM